MNKITAFALSIVLFAGLINQVREIYFSSIGKTSDMRKKFNYSTLYWAWNVLMIVIFVIIFPFILEDNTLIYNFYVSNFVSLGLGIIYLLGHDLRAKAGKRLNQADSL